MINIYDHDVVKTLLDTINTIPESEYEKYISKIYLNETMDEFDEQTSALLFTFKNIHIRFLINIDIKYLMNHDDSNSEYTVYEVIVVPNMDLFNIHGFRYHEAQEDVIKVANDILKKIIRYATVTMSNTVTQAIQEAQLNFMV